MATNFPTSLDTLTNPTSSDSLSSPSHSAQHANVNDAVEALEAKVGVDGSAITTSLDYKVNAIGTWTAYTPTWMASGTNPTVGNGLLTGRYSVVNELVFVEVRVSFGSTTTAGTGNYRFGTPVNIDPLASFGSPGGSGFLVDASASDVWTVAVGYSDLDQNRVLLRFTSATAFGEVGAAAPVAWAIGDSFQFGYVAKVA